MDMYEEMLLQIVEVLKKHNRPLPDLTHKEAIEEIRSIILGNTTHAEKVTPDDIKKLDNTDSSEVDHITINDIITNVIKLGDTPIICGYEKCALCNYDHFCESFFKCYRMGIKYEKGGIRR